ncbi:MAG: ketoacyl-ACP synthase III [Defluviitaleaceae bacterium]|nr:ketoacyl-ACP synthase III [Defluviitaleaceae bacterium]
MRIIATGSYTPSTVLTNDFLEELVDTNDEWITSRTGIKERRVTTNENTSDLAYNAAISALKNADIAPKDIDLIVVCTCTPDAFLPSVAGMLQRKFDISCMAFDLNAACGGFVYGIKVVTSLMASSSFKYCLLVGSEVLTKLVNWEDRNTCILFGDGAGAVILENSDKKGIEYTYCDAKGDMDYALKAGGVPLSNPFYKEDIKDYRIEMLGSEVFKFAVNVVYKSITKVLEKTNTNIEEISYFVCHQANYRILKKIAKDLKVDEEKFYMNLEKYGNTSSASIPIALDEMNRKGLLKDGMKIVLVGFGAGLTWGATLINW